MVEHAQTENITNMDGINLQVYQQVAKLPHSSTMTYSDLEHLARII